MTAIWDDRLITRTRAADMCGAWELKVDYPYLRCGQCNGNVTMLPAHGMMISIDVLMSVVVRHMTMNHGYSLSGSGNGDRAADGGTAGSAGSSSGSGVAGHPAHR